MPEKNKKETKRLFLKKLLRPQIDHSDLPDKHLKRTKLLKRILFFSVLTIVLGWVFWGIPLPTGLAEREPISTKLFDRNDKLIYEIYEEKRRTPVKLSELPDNLKRATIAIEDKDFYKHYGFSPTGILRAVFNIIFQHKLQGGSTLTQQLVKNSLLTPERTVRRKIREFVLSMAVEAVYSKDQILEMYLNQTPYGSTAYGVEAASELYFNKSAKDLNLAESSLLAGLPQRPSYYSPFGSDPTRAVERQKTVLTRMVENKYITQDQKEEALKTEIKYAQVKAPTAPHFALWIKEQLSEKYGEAVVEKGGLRVKTTLDLDLQEFAQQQVATEVGRLKKQNVNNGAAIVTRPKTGEILAMVGSKDYFAEDEDGKVNIIFAQRQPGSSIKPFNYALALRDEKITAATAFTDVPTCFSVAGQPLYCPRNYDGSFHGLAQTRFSLGNSFNIPAVRTLALNGIDNFIDFGRSLGLTTLRDAKNYGLSLTLGGGEVRPFDMAQAYSVLANQGVKQDLIAILEVKDWNGKVLEKAKLEDQEGDRVLSPEVTFIISHILYDNNARTQAFGASSFLNISGHPEVSVKTGTTNDRRDNWTIGYTPSIVALTWVGNNDNSPMSGAVSGVSGASPIWNKTIKFALDRAEKGAYDEDDEGHAWPSQPEGVIGTSICATTGLLPPGPQDNPGCGTRFEYFIKGTVPTQTDGQRLDIPFDKTKNEIGRPDTPPENLETQNHPVYYDPLGTIYCIDCAIPTQAITIRYPYIKN